MAWNSDIKGSVLSIASCEQSPLRVMAGPGTGKSFSMKRRIQRLLETQDIDPSKVLAITFTRTAAADMVKELSSLNVRGSEDIKAYTLHSYCFSVLMQNNVLETLGRFPRPLITYMERGILKFEVSPLLEDLKLQGEFGNKREMCRRIRAFESAWARLQSEIPGWPIDPIDNNFHRFLIEWLNFHNSMLIGEIIPETLRYLRSNPTANSFTDFDHVVIDEFQDLNKAEQVLIDLIASGKDYFIIGDEDQSIYSFRFAHPEGIISFNISHPDTHDESLTECRRCPQKVVHLANSLILHNHRPNTQPRLEIRNSNPVGIVNIVQWANLDQEAIGIAQYINYLISNKGYNAGDILILSPRRLIAYKIIEQIRNYSIPLHSYYYDAVLEETEGQKSFIILSLLTNIEDRVSLRFWLGVDGTNWRANQYQRIREYSFTHNISPNEVMQKLLSKEVNIPNTTQVQHQYNTLIEFLGRLRQLSTLEVFEELFPIGHEWSSAIRDAVLDKINENSSIPELFNLVKTFISQPENPTDGNYVKIMSLHKSKGLTSKIVIIPSTIQGLIPTVDATLERAEREVNLQEQRRLFYVAITRPSEILLISSFNEMNIALAYKIGALGGRRISINQQRNIASQFISELGPSTPISKLGTTWAINNYI
ncbi:MAG: ATP-dependent helicase [Ignavibacteriales bacterium]|nr:ATP-dependent helicase [Ignavibacteriales bacterium]